MKCLRCCQWIGLWTAIAASCSLSACGQEAAEPTAEVSHPIELLPLVDVTSHALGGTWKRSGEAVVTSPPGRPSMLVLPMKLDRSFEASFEFTRTDGDNTVGLLLPLGDKQVALELSGWKGAAHGISRVNGRPTKDSENPTSVTPGTLTNGQRYQVDVAVEQSDDDTTIIVKLGDKPLINWSGKRSQLEPNLFVHSADNDRLVLTAIDATVTFHSVTLRSGGIGLSKPPSPLAPGAIDLTSVAWQEKNGTTRVASFRGERVLELSGEEAVAFLPGVAFGDGTIECEIASATFSGLAFRGSDTKSFECLYFRPFNSGTEKHDNTIQYASHGVEGGGWADLRREFPGKYEAGADMKVNQWFHAKIVLKGNTLKAFVDDGDEPVLVVDSMLGGRDRGKIGVWGWGSYFRNFRFTPASD